jgi:hypothetical protein
MTTAMVFLAKSAMSNDCVGENPIFFKTGFGKWRSFITQLSQYGNAYGALIKHMYTYITLCTGSIRVHIRFVLCPQSETLANQFTRTIGDYIAYIHDVVRCSTYVFCLHYIIICIPRNRHNNIFTSINDVTNANKRVPTF